MATAGAPLAHKSHTRAWIVIAYIRAGPPEGCRKAQLSDTAWAPAAACHRICLRDDRVTCYEKPLLYSLFTSGVEGTADTVELLATAPHDPERTSGWERKGVRNREKVLPNLLR